MSSTRRTPLVLVLLIVAVFVRGGAGASEQSKRLYSRGLVDFHAERYSQALALFEQAVKADPEDAYARYYRGVTRGRLGDYAGAVADLRGVANTHPSLKQAALELGVALTQTGQFAEAVPWLERAQRVPSTEARASLFLGIAQLRLEQRAAARLNFERAESSDASLRIPAEYYQGVVAYEDGRLSQAEQHFSDVVRSTPDSTMGQEAAQFLANIRQGARPTVEVYGAVGFQYDSNVVLAASNEAVSNEELKALRISKKNDGRGTIAFGGAYVPWRSDVAEFSVGYEFYQSLHLELSNFNIQDHRPSAQIVVNTGPVQIGLLGRYDYYLLDTDSFLQEGTALPWLGINEAEIGRTEVYYRMRRRDFFKRTFNPRDSFNHAPGMRQFFYLGAPQQYVSVGYRFDSEEPVRSSTQAQAFAYEGHQGEAGVGWAFPSSVLLEATYAYRHEQYAVASAPVFDPAGSRRHDDEHLFTFAVHHQWNQYFGLTAGYYGTLNSSNKRDFDYDRHIGSVAFEAKFY